MEACFFFSLIFYLISQIIHQIISALRALRVGKPPATFTMEISNEKQKKLE